MYKLLLFPTPHDARCTLRTDSGYADIGKPDTHFSGRPGQSFSIPYGHDNMNGAAIDITAPGAVPVHMRAILMLNDTGIAWPFDPRQDAAIVVDDVHLVAEKVCPECPDCPEAPGPDPEPIPGSDPVAIGQAVYEHGDFDLKTKEGCGQYTEATCDALHQFHSNKWGHVKKEGAQNQYNGHAVDALNLLEDVGEGEERFLAGVYDIIFSSESADAKPTMNRQGPPWPAGWYYPAKAK